MRYIPLPFSHAVQAGAKIEVPAGNMGFEGFIPVIAQPGRQTIFSDDFSAGFETRHGHNHQTGSFDPTKIIIVSTTMNGSGAIALTYKAGTLPSVRWGRKIIINPGVSYDEGWFTYDVMLSDPFSPGTTSFGGKIPKVDSVQGVAQLPNDCADTGWQGRIMFRALIDSDTIQLVHYKYNPDVTRNDTEFNIGSALGIPHTIEIYFKLNSAHDLVDGVVQIKDNNILVVDEAQRMYCANPGDPPLTNRSTALIDEMQFQTFWGGASSAFSPAFDSTITYGAFKFEAPA